MTDGPHTFDPPGEEERGNDWVLVVDAGDYEAPRPPGAPGEPVR
jgi:hypothetical protein